MNNFDQETFTLENFEGPLEFLVHLIQKSEIDIYEIKIQDVLSQYMKNMGSPDVDKGAEFISMAALLIWLKSRMLLPKHEQPVSPEEEFDPRFDIIHQLVEYCKFKEAAKELSRREQEQNAFFERGLEGPYQVKKNLGIEHLTLQDLAGLFQEILSKAESESRLIHEEEWLVSDKLRIIRQLLKEFPKIGFEVLFTSERSREELIVTFLAVLELMKLQEIKILKENSKVVIHGT